VNPTDTPGMQLATNNLDIKIVVLTLYLMTESLKHPKVKAGSRKALIFSLAGKIAIVYIS
jgi:hypothetical protein